MKTEQNTLCNVRLLIYTAVALVLLPLLLVFVLLPILLYRMCVIVCAKIFRKDLCRIMEAQTCAFGVDLFFGSPRENMVTAFILKDQISLQKIKDVVNRYGLNLKKSDGTWFYDALRQYYEIWGGFIFWKWDTKFHVDNHVKIYEMNGSEDYICTSNDLTKIQSALIAKTWKEHQSPWEFWLIPRYKDLSKSASSQEENDNTTQQSIVIFRCHHGLCDGYSIVKLVVQNILQMKTSLPVIVGNKVKTPFLKKLYIGTTFVFRATYEIVKEMLFTRDENGMHKPHHGIALKHVATTDKIPVDLIREIRKRHNVSFATVLSAAVCGGVRKYMLENKIPIPEYVHACMPFPFPGHPQQLTNHFSFCNLKMTVGEGDRDKRIRDCDYYDKVFRNSTLPLVHFWTPRILGNIFVGLGVEIAKRFVSTTILLSNFPAPMNKIDFHGPEVTDIIGCSGGGLTNAGLGFLALSYNGSIRITLAADNSVVSSEEEAQNIVSKISEELMLLKS